MTSPGMASRSADGKVECPFIPTLHEARLMPRRSLSGAIE
jgi:hypothetical protein